MQFPKDKGKSYTKLYESILVIGELLKKSEIENIFKSQYLLTAIENVGTGLIWFNEKGDVLLVNKSTRDLLNIKSLSYISDLDKLMNGFSQIIKDIKPSEHKLIKLNVGSEIKHISIKATGLVQQGKHIKLISLHDIKNELDEAELDSWQKLIRVLAHEIMNSIGPITTSTTAVSKYFKDNLGEAIDPQNMNKLIIDNTIKGLEIIEERSIGLKDFVSRYRQLSNLPIPEISVIQLNSFIQKLGLLFKEELQEREITFSYVVNPINLLLQADEKLISQVIINLFKNAIEAIETVESPKISLKVFENDEGSIIIKMHDNGPIISQEILDKMFIPFFTTKEEGSGIGLSLSRQIMRLHSGFLNLISSEDGAVFQLTF